MDMSFATTPPQITLMKYPTLLSQHPGDSLTYIRVQLISLNLKLTTAPTL